MRKKRVSKKLMCLTAMPPLFHTRPGQTFDIRKSEVVQWLAAQPDILNYLWDQIRQSGLVAYDPETKTWQGVDYDNEH